MTDPKPIPAWYTREETPEGPLYFYPLPAVEESYWRTNGRDSWTWTDVDGNPVEARGEYLVSRAATSQLTATWPVSAKVIHYQLKAVDELSDIGRVLARDPIAFPGVLTPEEWRELRVDDEVSGAAVRSGMYEAIRGEPTTGRRTFDVSHLEQLDVDAPDPAPELTWTLESPAMAALYPRRAHHLFPGYLTGVFDTVAERVKAAAGETGLAGISVKAYEHDHSITVSADIPWDVPKRWEPVKGWSEKARELTSTRRRKATVGFHWYESVKIRRTVAGGIKAEALADLERVAVEYVAVLIPPITEVCGHCSGRGYIR